uniref:Alpha-MPP n=1 Tax=Enterobius vermicularis TaxID=51028 RepID=A0A0N4UWZ1_ENTVE
LRKLFRCIENVGSVARRISKRRLSKNTSSDSSFHFATVSGQLNRFESDVDLNALPLTEPLPGYSNVVYGGGTNIVPFDTTLTVLDSGLKVATEPHYGDYCTLGVAVNAGARYESGYPSGVSHFIEKLAFSGSVSFSREGIFSLLEQHGALIDCQSTRDTFIYASSCHVDGAVDMLTLIADAILRPLIADAELDTARQIISFENKELSCRPECEPLLTDWIHQVAFNANTIGFSKYCPPSNIEVINRQHLFTYMKQFYNPNRIVVAGIGVDHNLLVLAAEKLFNASEAIWASDSSLLLNKEPPVDNSVAQYTGGEKRISKDLSSVALGPTPFPNLAHFVLGFESCGFKDEDFVAFCVLQSLMGGGGSFSAGGPGKGMYTRLYVDVLNKYHYMFNATAFNHTYGDTGLFCIQASSAPAKIGETAAIIADQFLRLADGVHNEELQRAKTQLKSQLMLNLEIRPVMFEDLARQVLGHGYRKKPVEYIKEIEAVSNKDIKRIAERMLVLPPSIVGYGDLKKLPGFDSFDKTFAKRSLQELKPFSFFRF